MTVDGSSAMPRSTAMLHGPGQQAIAEFLSIYRGRPPRPARAKLFGRSPLDESCSGPYWEAVGELAVASALDRLGPQWTVIHGIPVLPPDGRSEVAVADHLVIGPAGIFTVITHNHARQNVWVSRRAFVVDGHRVQHIRGAEAAVGYVERMLEAAVGRHVRATTIIAVMEPGSLQVRDLPRDVFVIDASTLGSWLKAREPVLELESVAELAAYARREATWSCAAREPAVAAGEARERAEFDRIRHEVRVARTVRVAWSIGVVGVLSGVLVAVGLLQLVNSAQ